MGVQLNCRISTRSRHCILHCNNCSSLHLFGCKLMTMHLHLDFYMSLTFASCFR
jgi:hypothetical protein